MMNLLFTPVLALTLIAPAVTRIPAGMSPPSQRLTPAEVVTLRADLDSSLESLRAGRVDSPSLGVHERTELRTAQQRSTSLAALRGGFDEPSNNEWKWLAIGAGIVLLIVLL